MAGRRDDVIVATKFYGRMGSDANQQGSSRRWIMREEHYIGHSTFPASQIVEAQWVARDRSLQRFVTEQPAYSMLVRTVEADVLPTCLRHGMGVIPYSPLTGGWLSGRGARTQDSSRRRAPGGFPSASTCLSL